MAIKLGTTPAPAIVNLVVVYNPLDTTDRVTADLEWQPRRSVAQYLEGLPDGVAWGVAINGQPVEPPRWAATYLRPDDYLTLMPIPEGGGGGGGGKQVMRLVAMIAVAAIASTVAFPAAFGLAQAVGAGWTAGGEFFADAGFMSLAVPGAGIIATPAGSVTFDLLPKDAAS